MRFALLAYTSPEAWARLTREEHAAWWVDHAALDAELADRAVVVAEVGPAGGATVASVQVRGGEAQVVPGPAPPGAPTCAAGPGAGSDPGGGPSPGPDSRPGSGLEPDSRPGADTWR